MNEVLRWPAPFDPERLVSYEPLAVALRERGFDATADDGGHANYGIFIKLTSNPVLDNVFLGCAEGSWGMDITDREGYAAGGEGLDLSEDAELGDVLEQTIRIIRGINAVD
jgi:hypothetical protein